MSKNDILICVIPANCLSMDLEQLSQVIVRVDGDGSVTPMKNRGGKQSEAMEVINSIVAKGRYRVAEKGDS